MQLLLAIGSLTVMTGAVIAPNLPEIIAQLKFDPAIAGTLVSVHFLSVALSVPLFGILADTIGALPVLVPALVLYGLFGVGGAAMTSLGALVTMRVLLGVATGGITAASLGLMGKLYRGESRAQVLAYASSVISLANVVYPLLGGWIGSFHWQWAFYLYGVGWPLAVLALIAFQNMRPAIAFADVDVDVDVDVDGATGAIAPPSGQLLGLLRNPQTLRLLLALGMTSGTVYAIIVYVPLYLRTTLTASTLTIGIVLASKAMGATLIAAFGVRPLAKHWGSQRAIALGYGIMAVALMLFPQLHHIELIVPTALLFGTGFGIVVPMLYGLLSDQALIHLQSSILAAGTGSGFLGQFLSPLLLAPVFARVGLSGIFYVIAAIVGVIAFLALYRFGPSDTPLTPL
ncbi:MAG TPA: MFS transporter [Chroococcidiopsis sp.]